MFLVLVLSWLYITYCFCAAIVSCGTTQLVCGSQNGYDGCVLFEAWWSPNRLCFLLFPQAVSLHFLFSMYCVPQKMGTWIPPGYLAGKETRQGH